MSTESQQGPSHRLKLVVGLGNPGSRYASTRHNVGFRIVEALAQRQGLSLAAERFGGRFARGRLGDLDLALLQPLTWMNRSGDAVAEALRYLPVADVAADLLVVTDDVDLPFGRLRLRPRGGAGGHRGLEHVIERLGHGDFPRLRFGIGRPEGEGDTRDWVLTPFSTEEAGLLAERIGLAADAVEAALSQGLEAAMNRFNPDPARQQD